jgi:hypothetical protein
MGYDDHSGASAGYKFDISNGTVTAEQRVAGDHTSAVRIPAGATFAVASGSVTETITGTHATEILQFVADASDATLYHLASEKTVIASPTTVFGDSTFGYGFTIAGGVVTAMSLTETHGSHTSTHTLHTGPTTSFTVGADGTVTETYIAGHTIESTTYAPSGTAGLYAVTIETATFIQPGSATTLLDIDPRDRAKFTIDASGAVSAVQQVLADGSTRSVTPGTSTTATTTYSQLAAGYVVEVHTHASHSSYEVYHDGNGDGVYTEVAHGSGTTVDLVGLKSQISAAIDGVA